MKKIIYLLPVISLLVFLCGCEEMAKVQNPLVGNWITTVPLLGIQEIITIQADNTIYFNNPVDGMRIYSYEIIGDKMILTNLDSGKIRKANFKIIGDYKAIKIDDFLYYPYVE